MNKKIETLLSNLEEYNKKHFMFNILRETGEFLNFLIKIKKPKKILEVGTSNGYSTIFIASNGFEVFTIEQDKEKIKLAKENFKKANLKNIKILEGNALEILKKLNEKFDFVFIDATKKEYLQYLKLIKLNKNAIIVADNIITHKEKLEEYTKYLRKHYKSFLLNNGNGLEITFVP